MADDFYYSAKGDRIPLTVSTRSVAIAYRNAAPAKDLEALIRGDDRLAQFIHSPELDSRNIVLFRRGENAPGTVEEFAARLEESADIAYVSIVRYRGSAAVVITSEFNVGFKPEVSRAQIAQLNAASGVEILRPIEYGPNAFVLRVKQPRGFAGALDTGNRYYESGLARYAEPNFIEVREALFRPNDPFYSSQWHLPRIQSEEAWDITRGDATIIVAVLDTGIDLTHEDLSSAGKIVSPFDPLGGDNNPVAEGSEDHGTAVAGVAVADGNNSIGVSGAAPNCRLMPIRLIGGATTPEMEGAAVTHAVDNGAAVINNSWGPTSPPAPLPGPLGDALDHALAAGRGGLGAVVMFASGNDNLSISAAATLNGFANDDRVIAVGAVNDANVRSGYSNFGSTLDICAPSDGTTSAGRTATTFPADGSTLAIFTTDRTGNDGYNNARPLSPIESAGAARNYTGQFGGTSSACPLAAGVVALMLSIAPDLTRDQVLFVIEATADKVDFVNTDPVGQYLPNGHSDWYGFGRVNAFEAVKGARSSVPQRDFTDRVTVTLRRTTGDRFVATKTIQTIDARQRQAETAADIFIRGGPDGFLRAETAGAFDEVEVDA